MTLMPKETAFSSSDSLTQVISGLFGKKGTTGALFLPTVEFYNDLTTDEGLTRQAKIVCKWLGYKPRQLHLSYCDSPTPIVSDDRVELPRFCQEFPYQAGTLLGLTLMRYTLAEHFNHGDTNDELIEAATIERGLGLLVLNGLPAKRWPWHMLYHTLHQRWDIAQDTRLVSFRTRDYAQEVIRFALNFRIPLETWLPYCSAEAQQQLPLKGISHPKKHSQPQAELAHHDMARLWWSHLVLMALLVGMITATMLFVIGERPRQQPPAMRDAYDSSQALQKAYSTCIATVKQERRSVSTDEFFSEQHANATAERCTSIRNRYNQQVDYYNQSLANY